MSDLEEPRIRCPSCGKSVPAMKYCIYCGAKLPQISPRPEGIPPPQPPAAPPPQPVSKKVVPPPPPQGVDAEIADLMSGITTLYERKISLLDLFRAGEVSEKVFLKLYNEYGGKLSSLLSARTSKVDELKSKLNERNKRLNEVTLSLEEIEVRHKIGEIDVNTFNQKAEKLKREEQKLRNSVEVLKMNLNCLSKIMSNRKPREIRDLELKMRECCTALQKLVKEGKISGDTLNKVKPDIDETIAFLGSLIMDRKEREKELREQLEVLQTRYKVSEVSIEEYEKRKRELQEEIDKIWA